MMAEYGIFDPTPPIKSPPRQSTSSTSATCSTLGIMPRQTYDLVLQTLATSQYARAYLKLSDSLDFEFLLLLISRVQKAVVFDSGMSVTALCSWQRLSRSIH
jgi:hypothetical protein